MKKGRVPASGCVTKTYDDRGHVFGVAPQERPTRRALREREGADADDGEHAAGRRVAAKTAGDKEVIDTVKARLTSLDFANVLLRTAADYRRVIAIFVA